MEYLMFVCPLPKKSVVLCDYIFNSVAQFHYLQYFFWFVQKLWRVLFTAAQHWLLADLLICRQGAAAAGNLVLSKGIAPNASIEAI
jgi:hypothetical protein